MAPASPPEDAASAADLGDRRREPPVGGVGGGERGHLSRLEFSHSNLLSMIRAHPPPPQPHAEPTPRSGDGPLCMPPNPPRARA